MVAATELPIDITASAMDMANAMFGDGMTIINATYTGDNNSSGIYSNGDSVSDATTPSDTGVILSTGNAQDFTNSSGTANQNSDTTTDTSGVDGDAQLSAIAGLATYDAAIFEATFVPVGDTLTMQFTFSSEEYLEYVNAGYNDAVGIWVNGVQAELTIGDGNVSIDNINTTSNANLYIDNANSAYNTEMDGFTVTLTVKAPVNVGQNNTIRIGIADAGDAEWDSNLLIVGDSIQSVLIADDDAASVYANHTTNIDVLANDNGVGMFVTHINGIAVSVGDSVTLSTGEVITLNADGTLSATADGDIGTNSFSYSIEDASGNTDVAFVTLETTVPCFVAGTKIETRTGSVLIEDLEVGDQIKTKQGFKTLRWVGSRTTRRKGAHAPVIIDAGSFGKHDRLEVSPQHRIVVSNKSTELLFETREVLVCAKDLVNGRNVRLDTSNESVTYYHILFDEHQVVLANNLWSESFYPGEYVLNSMDIAAREEVLDLFPQLADNIGEGYGPACMASLQRHEAMVLNRAIFGNHSFDYALAGRT